MAPRLTSSAAVPPWLDSATSRLVEETVRLLVDRHGDLVLAVFLFGSVARHEERPLDDPAPSDVDVLAIFDTDDRLIEPHRAAIVETLGLALDRHPNAAREVNIVFAPRTLEGWDFDFITQVTREGITLYARDPLLPIFAPRIQAGEEARG